MLSEMLSIQAWSRQNIVIELWPRLFRCPTDTSDILLKTLIAGWYPFDMHAIIEMSDKM